MAITELIEKHLEAILEFKKEFPPGPWQQEPDRVEFKHAGLDCLLARGTMGNWCGYVGVPKGHPAYGKHYDQVDVDAYGGLTYAKECNGHICHVTETEDHAWWFGFDCAHMQDLVPGMLMFESSFLPQQSSSPFFKTYKNVKYVTGETKNLANELAAMT